VGERLEGTDGCSGSAVVVLTLKTERFWQIKRGSKRGKIFFGKGQTGSIFYIVFLK